MAWMFSQRSLNNLKGVHPHLNFLFELMLQTSPFDFGISEGLRTLERQKQLVAEGKSKTLASRHLTGHAVDVVLYKNSGKITWERSDYILFSRYVQYTLWAWAAVKAAERGIDIQQLTQAIDTIRWGGDWDCDGDSGDESFFDGPHFELNKKYYP